MFQSDLLQEKTIFITGGGTGLGKSMATRFMELGAHVVIASRKFDRLERTAEALAGQTGGKILPLALDVRDYRAVKLALDRSIEKFGSVDILVNNAAGNFVSPTEALSIKAFDVITDVFNLAQAALQIIECRILELLQSGFDSLEESVEMGKKISVNEDQTSLNLLKLSHVIIGDALLGPFNDLGNPCGVVLNFLKLYLAKGADK